MEDVRIELDYLMVKKDEALSGKHPELTLKATRPNPSSHGSGESPTNWNWYPAFWRRSKSPWR
jgi:hypothetical protein